MLHGIKRSVYHESIVVHDLPSTASHLRIKKMGLFDNHRHNFLQMVVMQVSVVNCSVVSGHLNGTDRTGLTCLERSLQWVFHSWSEAHLYTRSIRMPPLLQQALIAIRPTDSRMWTWGMQLNNFVTSDHLISKVDQTLGMQKFPGGSGTLRLEMCSCFVKQVLVQVHMVSALCSIIRPAKPEQPDLSFSLSFFLLSFLLSLIPSLFPSHLLHLSFCVPSVLATCLPFCHSFFSPSSLSFHSFIFHSFHLSSFHPFCISSLLLSFLLPFVQSISSGFVYGHPSWAWVLRCPWSHTQASLLCNSQCCME